MFYQPRPLTDFFRSLLGAQRYSEPLVNASLAERLLLWRSPKPPEIFIPPDWDCHWYSTIFVRSDYWRQSEIQNPFFQRRAL